MKLECACFEALPVYQVNNVLLNHSYFSKMLSVITLPIQFKTPKIRSYDMVPPRFTNFQKYDLTHGIGLLSWRNFTGFNHKVSDTFKFECKHNMNPKERQ